MSKNIPVTFLESLTQEYCSDNEQDRQAGQGAPSYHKAEQFTLPTTAQAGPPVIEISEVAKEPLLTNAKPPYYHNQKEAPVHRAMLHLSAKGYTVKEIAERTGRTPVCVNNILRQPMLQQTLVNEVKRVNGEDEQVVEVIKANVVLAVKTLADIVRSPTSKGSDRIAAANALLERRYGKANQPINRNTDVDLSKLSDKELAAMLPSTAGTGDS